MGPMITRIMKRRATTLNTFMRNESRTAGEERLELYQIFLRADRWVRILGKKAIRINVGTTRNPAAPRSLRPEVRTLGQRTTKGPSRFKAQDMEASSAAKRRSSKPPVARKALRVQNMKAPPVMPTRRMNKPSHHKRSWP